MYSRKKQNMYSLAIVTPEINNYRSVISLQRILVYHNFVKSNNDE